MHSSFVTFLVMLQWLLYSEPDLFIFIKILRYGGAAIVTMTKFFFIASKFVNNTIKISFFSTKLFKPFMNQPQTMHDEKKPI